MMTPAELPTAVGSSQAPTTVDNSGFQIFFGVHTFGTGSLWETCTLARSKVQKKRQYIIYMLMPCCSPR